MLICATRLLDTLGISKEFEAFKVGAHDDVDHARDRVRTIECGATVSKYLNSISHDQWDGVQVNKFLSGAGHNRSRGEALAVDERQGGVTAKISEVNRRSTLQLAGVIRSGNTGI